MIFIVPIIDSIFIEVIMYYHEFHMKDSLSDNGYTVVIIKSTNDSMLDAERMLRNHLLELGRMDLWNRREYSMNKRASGVIYSTVEQRR